MYIFLGKQTYLQLISAGVSNGRLTKWEAEPLTGLWSVLICSCLHSCLHEVGSKVNMAIVGSTTETPPLCMGVQTQWIYKRDWPSTPLPGLPSWLFLCTFCLLISWWSWVAFLLLQRWQIYDMSIKGENTMTFWVTHQQQLYLKVCPVLVWFPEAEEPARAWGMLLCGLQMLHKRIGLLPRLQNFQRLQENGTCFYMVFGGHGQEFSKAISGMKAVCDLELPR